jgi:integrase/recombinase XerD
MDTAFDIAIEDFLQHLRLERGLSENTLLAYRSDIRELVRHSGVKDPVAVSPTMINDYFGHLAKLGRRPTTLARKISGLKHFFAYLKDAGRIKDSPARLYTAPKISRYHPDHLSPEEIESIIKAIDPESRLAQRNRAIIELLYGSGLRLSELQNLKIGDIEFEAGFLRIVGKGNKQRLVPLGEYAKTALRQYLDIPGASDPRTATSVVFRGRAGKGLSRVGLWKIVKKLVAKAGITKAVTPHTFRHSFATHLVQGGADLRTLQEMLGHADISTTEIYTRVDRDYIVAEHRKHHPRERASAEDE